MLENAIVRCPKKLWDTESRFWYIAYHTLFYLDYYASNPEGFLPPPPFTLSEFDPEGAMPDGVYSKETLLAYLEYNRQKCYLQITGLTREKAEHRFVNEYRDQSVFEIILYNMRHAQHHVGQLNVLLRLLLVMPPNGYHKPGPNFDPFYLSKVTLPL